MSFHRIDAWEPLGGVLEKVDTVESSPVELRNIPPTSFWTMVGKGLGFAVVLLSFFATFNLIIIEIIKRGVS